MNRNDEMNAPGRRGADRRRGGRILAAAAGLMAIAALLLALSVTQSLRPASTLRENGFLAAEDAGETYAAAGNGLAVAGKERIRLFSPSGKCVAEAEVNFTRPACVGSSYLGAYYDLGAPGLRALYPDGSGRALDTPSGIDYVDVNETGLVTVLFSEGGEDEALMVYDTDLTPLFRWVPGSGMILGARTRGEDTLCVNCLTSEGAVVRFFRIDSDREQARLALPGEVVVDMDFLADGTLAAVTDRRLVLIDGSGALVSALDYDGSHLEAWSLGGGFAAVATASGTAGGECVITALAPDGRVLGSCSAARHIRALSGGKDALLVYYTGEESTLYDAELNEKVSYQPAEDVTQVFLTPNAMAFFAGPGGVTLVDFGR